MSRFRRRSKAKVDLEDLVVGPDWYIGTFEPILEDAGIPYLRVPGIYGHPFIEPQVTIRVPADRLEEAQGVITWGPGGSRLPPDNEQEVGFNPHLQAALGKALEKDISARDVVRGYVDVHPEDPAAWHYLIRVEQELSGPGQAETVAHEAISKHPDSAALRRALGELLEQQDKFEAARQVYLDLVRDQAQSPQGYVALATLSIRSGHRKQAQSYADQALARLDPPYQPISTWALTFVELELGNRDVALDLLTELVNWQRTAHAAILRAVVKEAMDPSDREDTEAAFDEARDLWSERDEATGSMDETFEEAVEKLRKGVTERNFIKKLS